MLFFELNFPTIIFERICLGWTDDLGWDTSSWCWSWTYIRGVHYVLVAANFLLKHLMESIDRLNLLTSMFTGYCIPDEIYIITDRAPSSICWSFNGIGKCTVSCLLFTFLAMTTVWLCMVFFECLTVITVLSEIVKFLKPRSMVFLQIWMHDLLV